MFHEIIVTTKPIDTKIIELSFLNTKGNVVITLPNNGDSVSFIDESGNEFLNVDIDFKDNISLPLDGTSVVLSEKSIKFMIGGIVNDSLGEMDVKVYFSIRIIDETNASLSVITKYEQEILAIYPSCRIISRND